MCQALAADLRSPGRDVPMVIWGPPVVALTKPFDTALPWYGCCLPAQDLTAVRRTDVFQGMVRWYTTHNTSDVA